MRRQAQTIRASAIILAAVLAAPHAQAIEFPLQFTPAGNYKDLVVAGYSIAGKTITGNCSYTAITSGSGRDPPPHYTPIPQTCTWNQYGALLQSTAGAPSIPAPIATKGTETIYASASAFLYTGTDSALGGRGFVYDHGAHYTWLTPNTYIVLPQKPHKVTLTLASDGDVPLNVHRVIATTELKATPDTAATKVVINSSTCSGLIPAGSTCAITLTYSDFNLTSPSGLAYDALHVHISGTSGVVTDFVQRYTLEVPIPVDGP